MLSFLSPFSIEALASYISIVSTVALLIAIYLWTSELLEKRFARYIVIGLMFYPWIGRFSFEVLPEPLYLALIVWGVYWFWKSLHFQSKWYSFLGGFFFSLAYLTRNEGFGYVCFGGVLFAVFAILQKRSRAAWIYKGMMYSIPVFLICGGYILYLHHTLEIWTLTPQIGNISIGLETGQQVREYQTKLLNPLGYIISNFFDLFLKYVHNLFYSFKVIFSEVMYLPFSFLFYLGLFYAFRAFKNKMDLTFILIMALPPVFIIPISHVLSRYYISLIPFLIIFVYLGVIFLFRRRFIYYGIILFSCLLSCRCFYHRYFNLLPIYGVEYKEAGLWIKDNLPSEAILLTPVRGVDYYGNRNYILIRKSASKMSDTLPLQDIIHFPICQEKPCYLIVQERWKSNTFYFLLEGPSAYAKNLERVYENNRYPRAKVVIYKVHPKNT